MARSRGETVKRRQSVSKGEGRGGGQKGAEGGGKGGEGGTGRAGEGGEVTGGKDKRRDDKWKSECLCT